jgi:rhomboid protease GluP
VRLRLPLSRARVVYVLLAINVLMYGLTVALAMLLANATGQNYNVAYSLTLFQLGAKHGPAIDAGQYWRFLTPVILHGGLIHLLFNSYALYALGPEAERIYGSARFLAAYLLAGLAGSIASYLRSPGLSIGASGAIFGLIGLLAVFFYVNRGFLGAEASRQQVTQLVSLAAINIVIGLSAGGIIDNWAHMGGLAAGTAAGFALAPSYHVDDRTYPPVIVRADHPARSWLLAAGLLVALVALAALSVGRYS